MNRFSPLRYPGGKGKLAPYLTEIVSLNDLEGGHYVEPFAGGAAVSLELLFSERVSHIHINDIDHCVYAFWHSIISETDRFIDKINTTDICVQSWLDAREVKRNPTAHTMFDLGFSTFFLNRTNRSGILNGGVIGGLDQKGAWKIGCRFNKSELISRISRIGFYRTRISLYREDAKDFLRACERRTPRKCLLYIDPPYYVKGAYLYPNHFEHGDHVRLSEIITGKLKRKWVVSYDNSDEISKMYGKFDQERFGIDYTARSYGRGTEIMVFSKGLVRPGKIYCSAKELREIAA